MKRILDCQGSDFRQMNREELLTAIAGAEGRTIACETICSIQPMLGDITNAEFAVGAAEEVIPRLYEEEGITADIVVVDPPRKGCDEKLLETILQISPEKIVYVSCNPATWARDLVVLKEGGYELKEVQPVDQFSHSVHVEVCSCLVKKK